MNKTLKDRLATKKLALDRQTIRMLCERDLRDVVGGTDSSWIPPKRPV